MSITVDSKFFELLSSSYSRLVGEALVPGTKNYREAALWLYEEAPFCVLAHNTEPDPRFVYANKAAQACFEYSWEEVTSLHSRLSAEAPQQEGKRGVKRTYIRRLQDWREISRKTKGIYVIQHAVWEQIIPSYAHMPDAVLIDFTRRKPGIGA